MACPEYFEVEYGLEGVTAPQRMRNYDLPQTPFFGQCFLCKQSGHSQRFCPLKFCRICRTYGHSCRLTWTGQPPTSATWHYSCSRT